MSSLQVDEVSKSQLLSEGKRILGKCIEPEKLGKNTTGLVIGYVQSGKTLSFTTVAALARDNGFQLIIIITGTSVQLTRQSVERIRTDLRLATRPDRRWAFFQNPRSADDFRIIRDVLAEWTDVRVPKDLRRTVLITVMKHHQHLKGLSDLMADIPLEEVPCLIVDDEGDQASLNTLVNASEESTTYRRILALRAKLHSHSYLQYTATPQAPLLINIIDTLSPEFVEILEPGQEYTGGEEFFHNQQGVLRTIPVSDLFHDDNLPGEPPQSLIEALRVFWLGVALGTIIDREHGNRTMLIHPGRRTKTHTRFAIWINHIRDSWVTILDLEANDPDKIELIQDFATAYSDLSETVSDLPPFDDVIGHLLRSVHNTTVIEVNAARGKTPSINWQNAYPYILIGGQAMDRGFTVEGLSVMYMPRGLGVGNADTVQQRARFYGYKKRYLNLCRVYLSQELRDAYSSYVDHEKSLRTQLVKFERTGQSLQEWKRQFLLSSDLRPTRFNVVSQAFDRGNYSKRWLTVVSPHYDEVAVASNRRIAAEFLKTVDLAPDAGHDDRSKIQRHMSTEYVELWHVHEHLLTKLRFFESTYTGVMLQILNYLHRESAATCSVFKMSSDPVSWWFRERGLANNGNISNLMQGANPSLSRNAYSGDRSVGDKSRVIVQLHRLNLTQNGEVVARDVLGLAIWLPSELSASWLVQDQS
ncbi:MAG: alpha-1,4 polygalactosaminidase [Chloroflexi bacterium]|nr:alpha-1,4 polygalactosaminidase [Chloroflexota bacterium]